MEHTGQQGRTQHRYHLRAAGPLGQGCDLLTANHIALHDFHAVGLHCPLYRASGFVQAGASASQKQH